MRRETEVDAGTGLVPTARNDLPARVEPEAVLTVNVQVAEERVFPAAEAVVAHRNRDRDVDPDHADVDLALEFSGGRAVAGENRRAVAIRVAVNQRDGFF